MKCGRARSTPPAPFLPRVELGSRNKTTRVFSSSKTTRFSPLEGAVRDIWWRWMKMVSMEGDRTLQVMWRSFWQAEGSRACWHAVVLVVFLIIGTVWVLWWSCITMSVIQCMCKLLSFQFNFSVCWLGFYIHLYLSHVLGAGGRVLFFTWSDLLTSLQHVFPLLCLFQLPQFFWFMLNGPLLVFWVPIGCFEAARITAARMVILAHWGCRVSLIILREWSHPFFLPGSSWIDLILAYFSRPDHQLFGMMLWPVNLNWWDVWISHSESSQHCHVAHTDPLFSSHSKIED